MTSDLVYLFPGQGSQRVGMGAQLLTELPHGPLPGLWELAESLSGLPIQRLCLEGPIEELTRTEAAQPALFTVGVALAAAAGDLGLEAGQVAGHSVGEWTAAVVAGALPVDEGLRLVVARGRLMARVQVDRPGSMAAISGLDVDRLNALCAEVSAVGTVVISNYNSPTQLVVAGETSAVDRLLELAPAAGAEQATRLPVGAAFHSPLMEPVRDAMAQLIDATTFDDPRVPVLANATGAAVTRAAALKQALIDQVASPVRWTECVRTFVAAGGRRTLELGPGRVLTGISRQTEADLNAAAADSVEKLRRARETLTSA
jgi:[acyl-carrier-protein] S-malonyltransferase